MKRGTEIYFPLAWKCCNVWPRCIQLPLRTYTIKHNHRRLQWIFSTVVLQHWGGRWKRVEGGQSGARQQAENLSHRHLTKSRWSPFSCRQKNNRSDGQAEQNEVKVILLKRGDRYSHSACMWTCVWMCLSSLPGTSISREMKLQRRGRGAGLSIQTHVSSRTCLHVCERAWMCARAQKRPRSGFRGREEVRV